MNRNTDGKRFLIAVKTEYVRDAQRFDGNVSHDIHENDKDWKDCSGDIVVMDVKVKNRTEALKQAVTAGYKPETLIIWQIINKQEGQHAEPYDDHF